MKNSAFFRVQTFVAVLLISAIPALATPYLSVFSKNQEHNLRMDECQSGILNYDTPLQVSCVCLNGIYSFLHYRSNCSNDFTWMTRAGQNHCFQIQIPQMINRIELVSSDAKADSLTILDGKYRFVKARYNSTHKVSHSSKDDTLVVVGTWTLVTPDLQQLCLISPPGQYCLFHQVPALEMVRPGCDPIEHKRLRPTKCHRTTLSEDMHIGCPAESEHIIAKRSIQGRSFLPASLAMAPPPKVPEAIEREEDFGLQSAKGSELIKSEVWTYLTQETSNILNDQNLTSDRVYVTPAFDILQLSKRIMAKSCPAFYVKPSHWDMSVTSFIAMQQRSFKFRESMIDLVEYRRIKDTLERCLVNLTEIPFIPPNETCVDGEIVITLEEGTYYSHGEVQTMNMIIDQMSTKNEPFIETVWKIFVHVHSLCFEYFKTAPSRINDHHRFTELLMPLFSNDVWDIWMKDADGKDYELKKDVYAGLLGDATKLMERVDYCAWFPRFEANYPWDLIRPKAKQQTNLRKKRYIVEAAAGTCATNVGDFKCS